MKQRLAALSGISNRVLERRCKEALLGDLQLAALTAKHQHRPCKRPGMKKEEVEALLGGGENTPGLGPIEDYLHAIATTEPDLPDFAIAVVR